MMVLVLMMNDDEPVSERDREGQNRECTGECRGSSSRRSSRKTVQTDTKSNAQSIEASNNRSNAGQQVSDKRCMWGRGIDDRLLCTLADGK